MKTRYYIQNNDNPRMFWKVSGDRAVCWGNYIKQWYDSVVVANTATELIDRFEHHNDIRRVNLRTIRSLFPDANQ